MGQTQSDEVFVLTGEHKFVTNTKIGIGLGDIERNESEPVIAVAGCRLVGADALAGETGL